MKDPHPESAEWTVTWTLRNALRSWIKPKDEWRPVVIAERVVADLRKCNWLLIKGPPSAGWEHDPDAIKRLQDQQREFDDGLKALNDLARRMGRASGKGSGDGV